MTFTDILFICIHLLSLLLSANSDPIEANVSRSEDNIKDDRVIGGREAYPGECPYQVALLANERFNCGGFFVRSNAVVTAAHCVHGRTNTEYKIRYKTLEHSTGPTINVVRAIPHPRYNPRTITNDIAVLILANSISPSEKSVKILDYTRAIDPEPNSLVTVSGWGRISVASNEISRMLKVANLTVISRRTCNDLWSPMSISSSMVCAMDPVKSSCNGDSGGPLVQNGNIVGIVSFGSSRCLHERLPNVYTRVSSFTPWIRSTLNRFPQTRKTSLD